MDAEDNLPNAHSFQLSVLQEYTEYHTLHQRLVHYDIV